MEVASRSELLMHPLVTIYKRGERSLHRIKGATSSCRQFTSREAPRHHEMGLVCCAGVMLSKPRNYARGKTPLVIPWLAEREEAMGATFFVHLPI
jgi:hypothetical protein